MAIQEQIDILRQGVETWNQWRKEHADIATSLDLVDLSEVQLEGANFTETSFWGTDLTGANLSGANLKGAHFGEARLSAAHLDGADIREAIFNRADLRAINFTGFDLRGIFFMEANLSLQDLSSHDLSGANLSGADLSGANLSGADLSGADLSGANLNDADLQGADLSNADLRVARLVGTNFAEATLTNCNIYGIAAWNVKLQGAIQKDLVITQRDEPTIAVDNLKIAQFIYLLLNNTEIREAIDTIAKKAVLILGRFTPQRKAVLDAIREALRTHGYLPILFDFAKPASLDLTETVSTLAHLARFIIADLTEPSSIPKELEAIVPTLAVPVQPLLEGSTRPYAMFKDYWKYQWVLKIYRYNGLEELLASLEKHVIGPAERKAKELVKLRAQEFEKR